MSANLIKRINALQHLNFFRKKHDLPHAFKQAKTPREKITPLPASIHEACRASKRSVLIFSLFLASFYIPI